MKPTSTYCHSVWLLPLFFLSSFSLSAQVSMSFEGVATNLTCTNSVDCNYNDPGSATVVHALMDNNGIPVSQMSSGSELGYSIVYTPTRILDSDGSPGPGLTDNQRFGVATSNVFNDQLGAPVPDGLQGFFMEDTDGEVEMTFDPVDLAGTTNSMFSMQYNLGPAGWEQSNGANDRLYVRIDIDNCAAATTITLLDTDGGGVDGGVGGDIDDNAMVIEGTWTTLMADLTPYVGCQATLIIEFDADATSEELGIDNIIFSQGSVAGNNSIVCPTVGAVSGDAVVCAGDPFDLTATGLADMASADNMEQDFGIEFKYFSSATSDPYSGGTSLGTVAFGSLTAGGSTATLAGATIPAADPSAFIYAVLSPAPTDLTCQPSAQTLIEVEGPAPAPMVEDVNACGGTMALIAPMSGNGAASPVQFWTEDFAEDGAGVTGICPDADPANCATNVAPANGQWSITGNALGLIATSDFLQVNSGQLVGRDLDSELCFLSEPIDISGYSSVDFSVLIEEEGDHETADYVDVNLIIDGADNLIANWMSLGSATHTLTGDIPDDQDFLSTTVTSTGLAGSMLQVEICMFNGAAAEMFKLDDITLSGTPVSGMFNFYDADPSAGPANLLAGPAASFDAGAIDRSIWVTEVTVACESAASEVVITAADTEAPEISNCPTTLSDGVVGFNCLNATPNYAAFITVTDDCDASPTVVQIPPTGTMLGVGMHEIKLVATDAAGNASDTCRFTLNNIDSTDPTPVCQNITAYLDASGNASIVAADVNGGSTDNCALASLSVTPSSFDCDDVGANTVNLTVTDVSGNAASCMAVVTVSDTISPVLTCQNITINIPADGDTIVSVFATGALVSQSDNCSTVGGVGVTGPRPYTCANLGDNNVTIIQDDPSGNQGRCSFVLTITDDGLVCNTPPVAVCQPVTVDADANCMATVAAAEFDGGSTDPDMDMLTFSVLPAGPYPLGSTNVTLTVSDGTVMSQCTTSVTVNDVTPPVVTCTEFSETFSGEDQCADFIGANSPTGTFGPIGDLTMFSVAAGGSRIQTVDLSACVTDNCTGGLQAAFVDSYEENRVAGCSVDIINVVVIRDAAGNEAEDSIFFRSTIMYDGPAPVITCPADSLIDCGVFPAISSDGIVATSGCGTPTLSFSENPVVNGEPDMPGTTYTYTVIATDGCGQTSMCERVFVVQDTVAPIVTCLDIEVILDANGFGGYTTAQLFTATDECSGVDFAPFDEAFPVDCSNLDLPIEDFITVSDLSGNVAAPCQATITVRDTTPPALVCQDIVVNLDENGMSTLDEPALYDSLIVSEVDECVLILGGAVGGVFVPSCDNIGPNTVGNFSQDGSNNRVECFVTVTVVDVSDPTIMANDTTLYLDENGMASLAIEDYEYAISDGCDDDPAITDLFRQLTHMGGNAGAGGSSSEAKALDAVLEFDCADVGTDVEVEIVGQDASGNETRETIVVTVLDTLGPVISQTNFINLRVPTSMVPQACPGNTIFVDEGLNQPRLVSEVLDFFDASFPDGLPLAFFTMLFEDNCTEDEDITVLITSVENTILPNGSDSIILNGFLIDEYGNRSVLDTATIVLVDDTAPEIVSCVTDTTIYLDEAGLASIAPGELLETTDNCGFPDVMVGDPLVAFDCEAAGQTFIFEETDTDASGNVSEVCTINVTVQDTIKPTLTCAPIADVVFVGDDCLFNESPGIFNVADNCGDPITFRERYTDEDGNIISDFTFEFITGDFTIGTDRQLPVGVNTIDLFVTDRNGLQDSCSFTLEVQDNIPPEVVTTDQTIVLNDDNIRQTLMPSDLVTATDNCGEPITIEFDRPLTFDGSDIGENIVTVTVTDSNGNEVIVTVTVIVTFDQPDLACIGEINLTLNDECQGLLIPQMLLTGNTGLLDAFDLEITVMDDDPSNGPIVDGCGSFQYMISDASRDDSPTIGFTGLLDEDNWTVETTATNADQSAEADFSTTELTLTSSAAVFSTGAPFGVSADLQFSEEGELSFDYNYNGIDAGFDDAIIILDFEGNLVETILDTDEPSSGSATVDIQAGYTLMVDLQDDGFQPFAGAFTSELTISNIVFTPLVSPLALDFETCWGIVNAEDKTPPAVVATPNDVALLCVDLDGNNLSTLPNTIDKCYRVNATTGATIPGSMAPALRARLLAGGTSPLVPTFTDGCADEIEVCVNDVVVFGDDPSCDDVVITRTFTATEITVCPSTAGEANESVTTSFELTFERPTLADLTTDNVEAVVEYDRCGTANPTRADYPAPRPADFPFLAVGDRTFPLNSGEAVCNIGVTFSDGPAIVTCPFTYKFIRTYTVIDWCDPSDVRTFAQVVKVGDTEAPVFTGPSAPTNANGDLVFGTNAGNICAAYLRLDDVSAVDNCSGTNVSISAEIYPGGDLTGTPIGAFNVVPGGSPELSSAIPAGRHILRYTFEDECGNADFEDFFFVVEDQTPPVAICEDGLNISIAGGTNNGFAVLTPDNIDAGSYDDCSGITRSIARVNDSNLAIGGYRDQITLTCADIGTVRVGLRVTDALGNENFCWLDVLVEDKLAPTCVAPGDVVITCDEYNTTLPADIMDATDATLDALFGTAAGVDNCGTTITQRISGDVNSCGVGSFTRTFTSTDDAGFTNTNNCTQRIRVDGVHDYRLTFPVDVSSDCAVVPEYDGVGAEELACDLITTTSDVDTLRTLDAGDECFKLRITYDVINWCEYNSFGEPYLVPRDGDGVNNRQRRPRDLEADPLYVNVLPGATLTTTDDDRAFMTLFTDRVFSPNAPQRDQPIDDNLLSDGDDNDYGDNDVDSRGFFRYVQFVKIYDEVAPEITFTEPTECFSGNNEDCSATVELTFTALDACSDAVVGVELDADYDAATGFVRTADITGNTTGDEDGNFTVSLTNVPVGEHAIRVRASDGCGNFDVQIIEFCVEADKSPTPICIQTLTVTLMDDGNGGGIAAIWASDFIASPIVDCFGNPVTKYSLYRTSDAGANGFVPAVGQVGIDDINCADRGDLSVRVYAFDDNGSTPDFCEVVVEVQDNAPWCGGSTGDLSGLVLTPADEAMEGVQMTLTGGMDATMLTDENGAFEFRNVQYNQDYTVQPSYDAAFSNRDVKTSDLVAAISDILGTQPFDNGYDYIAADVNRDGEHDVRDVVMSSRAILGITNGYDLGNWTFVTAETEFNLSNPYGEAFPEVYNVNDLQGSFRAADFVAIMMGDLVQGNGRSAQTLNTEDLRLEAGQVRTVVLDGTHLAGFQGTIELAAGLELVSVDYQGDGGLNLNRAAEGLVAVALRNEGSLTLEVRATEAGLLSELITLSDAITVREGVAANGTSNALELTFSAPASAPQNVLHQNTPNPVRDLTTISFELATAGSATLTLRDAAGRLVLTRQLDAVAGLNRIELEKLATGVLTYTLTSGDFTASRKMVVVK